MNTNELKMIMDSLKERAMRVGKNSPEWEGLWEEYNRLEKQYLSKTDKVTSANAKKEDNSYQSSRRKPSKKVSTQRRIETNEANRFITRVRWPVRSWAFFNRTDESRT